MRHDLTINVIHGIFDVGWELGVGRAAGEGGDVGLLLTWLLWGGKSCSE